MFRYTIFTLSLLMVLWSAPISAHLVEAQSDGDFHGGVVLEDALPAGAPLPVSRRKSTSAHKKPLSNGKKAGDMYFYEAGSNGAIGPRIYNGITFCPSKFASGKYSIRCIESSSSRYAKFFINGVARRTEHVVPYFANGDSKGVIAALTDLPSEYVVGCQLSGGVTKSSRVKISCESGAKKSKSTPTSATAATPAKKSSGYCAVMDAKATKLTAGWTRTNNGVVYKANDRKRGVDAPGEPLVYRFTPRVSARYAFVLDMSTKHNTEHNDVWARFPAGGWTRMRYGKTRDGAQTGFIKAYHNKNGRASIAKTIDHAGHSIATARKLEAGTEYVVELAGRSTMVTVHRIIMFPCGGIECERTHTVWKERLDGCDGK